MTGGQDGGAVLVADADDLRREVGMQSQLVADGRREHVARRHPALLARRRVGGNGGYRRVVGAVRRAAVNEEVVAADAVEGGRRTGIDRCVAYGRNGGEVVDEAVVARESGINQTAESVVRELVIVTREVVPAHLVDHDANHQLRLLAKLRTVCQSRQPEWQHGDNKECLFHLFTYFWGKDTKYFLFRFHFSPPSFHFSLFFYTFARSNL